MRCFKFLKVIYTWRYNKENNFKAKYIVLRNYEKDSFN